MKHGMKTRESLGKTKRRNFSFAPFFNPQKAGCGSAVDLNGVTYKLGTHQREKLPIREYITPGNVVKSKKRRELEAKDAPKLAKLIARKSKRQRELDSK